MATAQEIKQMERELDALKKEYMEERLPCMNTKCNLYSSIHKNHCSWTVFHDECNEYKTEED